MEMSDRKEVKNGVTTEGEVRETKKKSQCDMVLARATRCIQGHSAEERFEREQGHFCIGS